jgi:hypothetical protein
VLPSKGDQSPGKSDRVVFLTASCVRSIVRLRFAYEMPMADAIDLARVHDLRSATEAVREKLEVLRNVPEAGRARQAVAEAKLTRGLLPREELERTIKLRERSIGSTTVTEEAEAQRETLVTRLRALRRDWERWGREYSDFMDSMALIHSRACLELEALHLPPEVGARAEAELEAILLEAVSAANGINPGARRSRG